MSSRVLPLCVPGVFLVALGACGGSPPPTAPDQGSLTASLTVTVDNLGSAVAIPSVSSVRFDGTTSVAPEGRAIYFIDYGDGTSTPERTSHHVYTQPGEYRATLTVTDGAGRTASTTKTVVVRAVEGSWFHFAYNPAARGPELRRITITEQRGREVEGEFVEARGAAVPLSGTIEGERALRLQAGGTQIEGVVPSQVIAEDAPMQLTGLLHVASQPLAFRAILGEPIGPPPMAKLHIEIDGISTAAINGFTPISYSAENSEADSPMYVLEFGDGEFTTDVRAVHRCNFASLSPYERRTLHARLTVVDSYGRMATTSRSIECTDLSDTTCSGWINETYNPATSMWEHRLINFSASGDQFSGFYRHPTGPAVSRFTGTLHGVRGIRFVLDGGGIDFSGEVLLVDDDRRMRLTLRGGSADGMTLEFRNSPWAQGGTYC
jgi:PKD repeat protein